MCSVLKTQTFIKHFCYNANEYKMQHITNIKMPEAKYKKYSARFTKQKHNKSHYYPLLSIPAYDLINQSS